MIEGILENFQAVGPFFVGIWVLTILMTLFRPQSYLNSLLLVLALMGTLIFAAGFMGREAGSTFLMTCFILIALVLFLVPVLLIVNGFQMIRREAVRPAHLLSLFFGIAVGIGEIASVIYVLSLSDVVRIGGWNRWILLLAATVFYFSFLVLCFALYSVFMQIMPHRMDFNYVIIHGCGLSGGEKMTRILSNRVDKAMEIYEKCAVKPFLIPSGGQGADEKISEAQAMKDYMILHGIPEDHILMEDRSASTKENLAYSKKIIEERQGGTKTALVSSNYHIYRCLLLGRDVGLKCTGIGADIAFYYWPSALIREFIAVFISRRFCPWAVIGYLLFISPFLYSILK